jgi:hypothetical protein
VSGAWWLIVAFWLMFAAWAVAMVAFAMMSRMLRETIALARRAIAVAEESLAREVEVRARAQALLDSLGKEETF